MARTFTQVAPDSTGDKIAAQDIVDGTDTVLRQEVLLADPTTLANVAGVGNAAPTSTAQGLIVRPAGDGLVVLNGSTVSGTATLATQDTSGGYGWFQIQTAGTYVFTLFVEVSDDNTNWQNVPLYAITNALPSGISTSISSGGGQWWGYIRGRYVRVRCTAFTSSASGAVTFVLRSTPPPVEYINANITGGIAFTTSSVATVPNATSSALNFLSARVASAATTNATSVKGSAGNLYSIHVGNNAAYDVFLKVYNKATAPTVGTDTPISTFRVPAGQRLDLVLSMDPLRFSTGIAYAITKLVADTDTTAVAVDDLHGFINYA